MTTLTTANPPLTWRLVPLQILLAEAQRQCGDVTTALHTLSNSLTAVGNTTFKQTFPTPLCAALIAADLGDAETAQHITAQWDQTRRTHGLPVPIGFIAAANSLGPDPNPSPPGRWDPRPSPPASTPQSPGARTLGWLGRRVIATRTTAGSRSRTRCAG